MHTNLKELLDDIATTINRFCVLPGHSADAVALYVAATWYVEIAYFAPLLVFTSPEMRCGKTTAMEIVDLLVREPHATANISTAALFRLIDQKKPTLLIDEVDATFKQKNETSEAIRGIINAGHRRGRFSTVNRVVSIGEKFELATFSVFGFKVLAGIGKVAATMSDRAIIVALKRKRSDESIDRLRLRKLEEYFAELRDRCETIAAETMHKLADCDPEMPTELDDRAKDNWELLVAIADEAGGEWPDRARRVAVELSATPDEDSYKTLLLNDLRDWFDSNPGSTFVGTKELLQHLEQLDLRPWVTWHHGTASMTSRELSKVLLAFGIEPTQRRVAGGPPVRGYSKDSCMDAFDRYCPKRQTEVTPLQNANKPIPEGELSVSHSGNGSGEKVVQQKNRNPGDDIGRLPLHECDDDKAFPCRDLHGNGNAVTGKSPDESQVEFEPGLDTYWDNHDTEGPDGQF